MKNELASPPHSEITSNYLRKLACGMETLSIPSPPPTIATPPCRFVSTRRVMLTVYRIYIYIVYKFHGGIYKFRKSINLIKA